MHRMKNNPKPAGKGGDSARVIVHFDLEGDEAARFLDYMRLQHLKKNAVAGRKLMLERLEQVEAANS